MRSYFVGPILLILTACASEESNQAATAATAESAPASGVPVVQQNCHRETKPGTNLFMTVCGSASQAQRQDMLDGVARMLGPQPAGNGFSKSN